jgi:hypothetical protein
MRRRRSSTALLATCLALVAGRPEQLLAQSGLVTEGAPFLLIPVGARALGSGQAVVAVASGTEAVWWNPAGPARAEKREVAVHHYQSFVGTGDVVSIMFPSARLGVFTASGYILNYGETPNTDENGFPIGSTLARNLVWAATYSTAIGSRVNAGVTFKVVQFRLDCSGSCASIPEISASTSAIDLGAQYEVSRSFPLSVGVALRHLGVRLQVNDEGQADPLPTRIQIGAASRVIAIARHLKEAELRLTADLIDELDVPSPAARVGADLSWQRRVHVRGGYVFEDSEAAGASIGFGLSVGGLNVDLARLFEGFSPDAGEAPVYVSLRYLF